MSKSKKLWLLGMIFFFTAILIAGCGGSGGNTTDDDTAPATQPRKQIETVKPNEDDGAVYRATEDFIKALVNDDRQKVLSLLTADHRNSWRDDSYLLKGDAKSRYELALENLNYTVVSYVNNEQTNMEDNAIIIAVYDVVKKSGGEETGRVKWQESLVFRKENGQWLIALDERGPLVQRQ